MTKIVQWLDDLLINRLHIEAETADFINTTLLIIAMLLIAIGVNWLIQALFRWFVRRSTRLKGSRWHNALVKRKLGHHLILLIPGFLLYVMPYLVFERGSDLIRNLHRMDIIFIIVTTIMILNSMLLAFLDFYMTTDKNRIRPLHGLVQVLQVILYFIGGIITVSIIIDKSPAVLLTGLGASAAVLMLIFKDSILGFVAGVQLSQNDMIKLGDWIQMPDGSANGNVEEITLNTVKVRNWDNTITMIPPYTLVTTPFKNWRGMQESRGRRADKCIFVDLNTLEVCTEEMISDIVKAVPQISGAMERLKAESGRMPSTNAGIYLIYIENYLRSHPDVNPDLDIIVTQKEVTPYGLPIYVYFFTMDKAWAGHERKQSDIFGHLMTMAVEFGLKLYQRP